jgi:hypothetical protein
MPLTLVQVKTIVDDYLLPYIVHNGGGVPIDLGSRGGVTIDLITGHVLTEDGFCVAYAATQDNHGLLGNNPSMTHAINLSMIHARGAQGSGIIGVWNDHGTVYFDSVKKYSTRHAAVEAAKKEGQLAIYNLNTHRVEDIMVAIGPDGTALPTFSFIPSLRAARRKRSHSFSL